MAKGYCPLCLTEYKTDHDKVVMVKIGREDECCQVCYYKKLNAMEMHIPQEPIVTAETFLVLAFSLFFSFILLMLDSLWFVSTMIYVAIGIDIVRMVKLSKARKEEEEIRAHFDEHGTYSTLSSAFDSDNSLEDVSHLEHKMDSEHFNITFLDEWWMNLSTFLSNVFGVFEYMKMTIYATLFCLVGVLLFYLTMELSNFIQTLI